MLEIVNISKSSTRRHVLLVLLVLFSLVSLTPSRGETYSDFFREDFEEISSDPAKWVVSENTNQSGNPAYGGSISLANGSLLLSSNGTSFPFIYSAFDPFPSSGDFEVEFAVEYTCIGDYGCGVMLSNGIPDLSADWHSYRIITLWAHDQGPDTSIIYIEFYDSLIYQIPVHGFRPSSSEHIYRVTFTNGTYSIYVDGIFVARAESQQRPNMIVFGNPPYPELPLYPESWDQWSYWGWSAFKVDFIRVRTQANDLTPTHISLATNAETKQLGTKMNLFGNLTGNDQPIDAARIILSVSMPGVSTWQPIASTTTNSEGAYSASWIPTATGEFAIRAEFPGDDKFAKSLEAKNISIIEGVNEDVFVVESNSTLSSLAFNSTSCEMSFTVSGETETRGYVRFTVSKDTVPDPAALKVFLDGNQLEYTVGELNDKWQLYFVYSHSKHMVRISMPQSLYTYSFPTTTMAVIVLAVLVTISTGSIFCLQKHKQKSKPQNRNSR